MLPEPLTNAARHPQARRVDIELVAEGEIVLRVIDAVCGIPADRRSGGRGLLNTEARAGRLGGVMHATPGREAGAVLEWRVATGPSR